MCVTRLSVQRRDLSAVSGFKVCQVRSPRLSENTDNVWCQTAPPGFFSACRWRLERHIRLSGSFLPFLKPGRVVLLSRPRFGSSRPAFPRSRPADGMKQVRGTKGSGFYTPSDEREIEKGSAASWEDVDVQFLQGQRSTDCPYEGAVSELTFRLLEEHRLRGVFSPESQIWGWGVVLESAQVRPRTLASQVRKGNAWFRCF